MYNVDKKIFDTNNVIEQNISKFDDSDRGLLSQNILSQLRNLVEYIFLKIYNTRENQSLEPIYDNFRIAEKYVKSIGTLRFLGRFHNLLQISTSHYTNDIDAVILGCTELPLVINKEDVKQHILNPLELQCKEAFEYAIK